MAVTRMPNADSELMQSWAQFKKTEEFKESRSHAVGKGADPKSVEGAMWAAYMFGFGAAGGTILEETPT